MEKTISQEERIRRAEEIYQRRKMATGSGIRVSSSSVNKNKPKISLFKKMALQLAICAVIYIIFYLIKNTNYIFSNDVINKTKELLSYDINFGNVYSQASNFIENNKDKLNILGITQNELEENIDTNGINVNEVDTNLINANEVDTSAQNSLQENSIENTVGNETKEGGIGGAEANKVQEASANEDTKKSQMEIDAEYVKKNYSFKIPLQGIITSRYGVREATEIVSANHQGIDIGANIGTAIYVAMEGTVTLVSSEGEYRKTCRNYKWGCDDKICTLQQNIGKTRFESKTRAENSGSRRNRTSNGTTLTL